MFDNCFKENVKIKMTNIIKFDDVYYFELFLLHFAGIIFKNLFSAV